MKQSKNPFFNFHWVYEIFFLLTVACSQAQPSFFKSPIFAPEPSLENIIYTYPKKYKELSQTEIAFILSILPMKKFEEALDKFECSDKKPMPSFVTIVLMAIYGNISYEKKIDQIHACLSGPLRTELGNCEYYCQTGFARNIYQLRKNEKIERYVKDNIKYKLLDKTEDELIKIIKKRHLNGQHEWDNWNNAVYTLGAIGNLTVLLEEYLWFYGRDASGGRVISLENAILEALKK